MASTDQSGKADRQVEPCWTARLARALGHAKTRSECEQNV